MKIRYTINEIETSVDGVYITKQAVANDLSTAREIYDQFISSILRLIDNNGYEIIDDKSYDGPYGCSIKTWLDGKEFIYYYSLLEIE